MLLNKISLQVQRVKISLEGQVMNWIDVWQAHIHFQHYRKTAPPKLDQVLGFETGRHGKSEEKELWLGGFLREARFLLSDSNYHVYIKFF